MSFIQQPLFRYGLLTGFIYLTGCANSPVIKTPVDWYHNLEGGIVSQPRLPVPGNDQSYPYVGLTPTQAPALPSPALRSEITTSLTNDRTLSDWQNTVTPLEIPKVPTAPQQSIIENKPNPSETKSAANSQNAQESSANFDAVGQDPTSQTKPADNQSLQRSPQPTENKQNAKPKESSNTPPPEPVVMPELRTQVNNQAVVVPAIPVNPPPPSKFPGFNIPSDANLPPPFKPSALPLDAPKGELVTFPIDSDTPNLKQDKLINSIAWQRHGRTIFVHGYGDAYSINPKDQTRALSLALLRAKTVAKMLIAHNVPESSIIIRAHAIGHGVRIRMDE